MKHNYLIFIGRFQPLHAGHVAVIQQALKLSEKVIILIGGANLARSPRNPFTYEERKHTIEEAMRVADIDVFPRDRVICRPINDFPYNDSAWIASVQKTVDDVVFSEVKGKEVSVGLIGYGKDNSSYYLKMFPDWNSENVDAQHGTLSATDLREDYFRRAPRIPSHWLVPEATTEFLTKFMFMEEFKWLLAEAEFYKKYKEAWGKTPYPVFINCVDAVVVQSGHILLVERANSPGKGLLALPGGHVEVDESFENAVIRELKEETKIADLNGKIPPAMLTSFIDRTKTRLFDGPHRSERGRVITQAYLFRLPDRKPMFTVKGEDDARSATWYELGCLKATNFFEDHAAIISEMTGVAI